MRQIVFNRSFWDLGRVAGKWSLELLLPSRCMCCDAQTDSAEGLCGTCWSQMPFLERPWCSRLGTPFSHFVGPDAMSAQAIVEPPVFNRLRSAVKYDSLARELVHKLKYTKRRDLAPAMARWMVRSGDGLLKPDTVVVPVPLHRLRLWQRRFNQAADLGKTVSRLGGCKFAPMALVRTKSTAQQVGLTAKQREKNVRNAFKLNPKFGDSIVGRQIVLVDDVYTTGSTVTACVRILLSGGASSVDVLTFAQAAPGNGLQ